MVIRKVIVADTRCPIQPQSIISSSLTNYVVMPSTFRFSPQMSFGAGIVLRECRMVCGRKIPVSLSDKIFRALILHVHAKNKYRTLLTLYNGVSNIGVFVVCV
jgi:hypothetical protein